MVLEHLHKQVALSVDDDLDAAAGETLHDAFVHIGRKHRRNRACNDQDVASLQGIELCIERLDVCLLDLRAEEETEINGIGPRITEDDVDQLYARLDALVAGDVLVIAGSVPSILPADMYERIMGRLDGRGINVVVDAERDLLVNVLQYHPFLIKPNNHELGDIFGVTISKRDEVEPYARKLQERGARNVLVSMAGEGAVLVPEQGDVVMSEAPKGTLVNSVGAGDSMVAGFLAGYLESEGVYEQAFRMGVCTGSASAFSANLATRPEVEALLETI